MPAAYDRSAASEPRRAHRHTVTAAMQRHDPRHMARHEPVAGSRLSTVRRARHDVRNETPHLQGSRRRPRRRRGCRSRQDRAMAQGAEIMAINPKGGSSSALALLQHPDGRRRRLKTRDQLPGRHRPVTGSEGMVNEGLMRMRLWRRTPIIYGRRQDDTLSAACSKARERRRGQRHAHRGVARTRRTAGTHDVMVWNPAATTTSSTATAAATRVSTARVAETITIRESLAMTLFRASPVTRDVGRRDAAVTASWARYATWARTSRR